VIVPDVNVLVYAFNPSNPEHARVGPWLAEALAGQEAFGLVDHSLQGFVRVVTDPKIWRTPATPRVAASFVADLVEAPASRWLPSGPDVWRRFADLAQSDPGIRGKVVPDAYLAAVALAHGARIATSDRGFGRFPGVKFFDPSAP
jgi:toxin-antitoxin system PIN domain toxin